MVLYSIIQDTLTKDAHRTVPNVINIIKIITWSVFQRTILDYLCRFNKEGSNFLKFCNYRESLFRI